MIIERYLVREILLAFAAVSFLLLIMFLSGTFVRILAEAMDGDFPAGVVFSLFALKGMASSVLILPLAFFLAVMLALGRWYKDSEMVALIACGVGPQRILWAVGVLGLILAVLVAVLALYGAPWAEERSHQILDQAQSTTRIEGIISGRFNQASSAGPTFYVESIDVESQRLKELFVQGDFDGTLQLITAVQARQQRQEGSRYLILEQGHRYEGRPGEDGFTQYEFSEHGIRIKESEVVPSKRRRNAIPSGDLLASDNPSDIAELQWRLALPITTLLLGLFAVPLSKTSPRQGRFAKLFLAIMIYIIYNNLLTVARSSLSKGEVEPWLGMWWVHLTALAILVVLIQRHVTIKGPKGDSGVESSA